MTRMHRTLISTLVLAVALGGCALPQPYQTPGQGPSVPVPAPQPDTTTQTQPVPEQPRVEEPQPLPPPVIREPALGAASRALVDQAKVQAGSKNFTVAAGSIERALRIEPDNPLLWIELGKVRQAEGNFVQAENMGRKALSMSTNAPRAQSTAWSLIADSYRSRGKNAEARDADLKAGNSSR